VPQPTVEETFAPVESPAPEPTAASPAASATPGPVALAAQLKSASPKAPAAANVALVGLGVAGVIGALLIVLVMATVLISGLVIPLIVVRSRTARR
jgi:Flp pilus assembly protein TadB